MIRVRISKWVRPENLVERGYTYIADTKYSGGYYTKKVGSYELQVKLGFPSNFRIKDWDDNRTPWILMKFLLSLEEGNAIGDKIKVIDNGKYKILNVSETLELIKEISHYTDIQNRLTKWYQDYIDGTLRF